MGRTKLRIPSLKGQMVAVAGEVWEASEELPRLNWHAPRPIAAAQREAVQASLHADAHKPLEATDPYGAGKELAALGRLALIAGTARSQFT